MIRTLRQYMVALIPSLLTASPSRSSVLTESGLSFRLDRAAEGTVRRLIGRRPNGVLSDEDWQDGEKLLAAVDAACGRHSAGDIFEVSLGGSRILFVVDDHGLTFAR